MGHAAALHIHSQPACLSRMSENRPTTSGLLQCNSSRDFFLKMCLTICACGFLTSVEMIRKYSILFTSPPANYHDCVIRHLFNLVLLKKKMSWNKHIFLPLACAHLSLYVMSCHTIFHIIGFFVEQNIFLVEDVVVLMKQMIHYKAKQF